VGRLRVAGPRRPARAGAAEEEARLGLNASPAGRQGGTALSSRSGGGLRADVARELPQGKQDSRVAASPGLQVGIVHESGVRPTLPLDYWRIWRFTLPSHSRGMVRNMRAPAYPTETVGRAASGDADGLYQELRKVYGDRQLKVAEVAKILGVSSPQTIRNWLEEGVFPGVDRRTVGGHRRFRLEDVCAVMARMAHTAAENDAGSLVIEDFGDEDPYDDRLAPPVAPASREAPTHL
jgi:excisionase family DNA binding protein